MPTNAALMRQAVELAHHNRLQGGRPFGAVLVRDGEVLATGINEIVQSHDPSTHAEMQAITAAASYLGGKYLIDCTLYVTVEPCLMCAAALGWSQISRVVWGADDPKRGYHLFCENPFHKKTILAKGVLADECAALMSDFFRKKR